MVNTISIDELKNKIERGDGFFLYEALPIENYRHSHLPHARHLPPDKVLETVLPEVADKQAEIVVYCANTDCHSSANAARELMAMGYENVREYKGGKEEWNARGLPMERYQRRSER